MKTRIIEVDPLNPSEEVLREPAVALKRGELVAFPTETVYGLGANAFDPKACERIFLVKGRPPDNPLIVHISFLDQLEDLAVGIPEKARLFIDKLWPGPLTVILPKSEKVPDIVTAGLKTVAVRMPSHPVARKLIELSGVPIAAPSANLSGRPSPTRFEHVLEDLFGKVEFIIDGGETLFGLESTIIDFTKDPPMLLRPGPLTVEELMKIGKVEVSDYARGKAMDEKPPSPGLKYRHYAPEKPLILVEDLKKIAKVVERYESVVVICPEESKDLYKNLRVITVGSLKEPYSIAKGLFDALRSADKTNAEVIIVEGFEERGILFSVMNRLRKAASEVIR